MEKTEDGPPSVVPLERALDRLNENWVDYQADTSQVYVRDALIKRFEFTYELSHKTLRRFLEFGAANEEIAEMSFPDLIRTASGKGLLLEDWSAWYDYRKIRGKATHTYQEKVAAEVIAVIPAFIKEVEFLRDRLREKMP